MRSDINILWIEDSPKWQEKTEKLFRLRIEQFGLLTNIKYISEGIPLFFEQIKNESKGYKIYDIIFIDGLHTKEQVSKDIVNSLKCLNPGGKIVLHDCLPPSEEHQVVPRIPNCGWCGDVWKAIPEFIKQGLEINVVNCDFGCGIINYYEHPEEIKIPTNFTHSWPDLNYCGNALMNIISPESFLLLLLIDK